MAHVKKGHLVKPPEWWKHLRHMKRAYWKKHRGAERRHTRKELQHAQVH